MRSLVKQQHSSRFFLLWSLGLACAILISGCSLRQETHLTQSRASVKAQEYSQKMPAQSVDGAFVEEMASHYRRYGDGAIDVTVLYDPKSRTNTAMRASQEGARISAEMRDAGLHNVDFSILPVQGQGNVAEVMISYDYYTAHAPDDCEPMSGYQDNDASIEEDYKFGCTVETVLSKQISRPKDMKGRTSNDTDSDGRRLVTGVERYRTGQPNESLGGLSATD